MRAGEMSRGVLDTQSLVGGAPYPLINWDTSSLLNVPPPQMNGVGVTMLSDGFTSCSIVYFTILSPSVNIVLSRQ